MTGLLALSNLDALPIGQGKNPARSASLVEGLEDILAGLSQRTKAVSRFPRSIMTPLIIISSIAIPSCITGAAFTKELPFISYALSMTAILCVLTCLSMFVFFSLKHPERLQSEDYLSTKSALQIISKQGKIIVLEKMDTPVENPDAPKKIDTTE